MIARIYLFLSMLLVFLPEAIFGQIVQITSLSGSVNVESGEYRVYSNVWGASTPQTLSVDTSSTYFKVDSTGHNVPSNGPPAAYPFILKGSHFNGTPTPVNDPFPVAVTDVQSCPTTWKISGTSAPGVWDCSYDIWFVQGGSNKLEMMIWINYQGPQPAGSQVATATINGISWQVWWNNSGTVSYRIVNKTDSCSLDIRNFMNDAVARGYLNTAWDLGAVEAGFEIWQNGANLTCDSFSVNVLQGLTTMITVPLNGASFAAPANITINATASEAGAGIAKVEFYQGSMLLGTSTTSPYSYVWSDVPIGNYKLTTKATDEFGGTAISDTVNVSVIPAVWGISMKAKDMILTNYYVEANSYLSGDTCIHLSGVGATGDASYYFSDTTGLYDMTVWYFDENDGECTMRVYVDSTKADEWVANQDLGSPNPVAQTRTSRTIKGLAIAHGAKIELEAVQNGQEWGRYDNVEITPVVTKVNGPINDLPTSFQLGQNYPNPFNPTTEIQFGVDRPGNIDLSVYDVLGQRVATLARGYYRPGKYRVSFDAAEFAAGVYFYRLQTENRSLTRRCMLVK